MSGVKIAAVAAGIALVAVGAAAPFTSLPVKSIGSVPDVLSMLHKRSPEQRPDGAVSSKGAVSMKLPAAVTPAAPPKVAAAAAPAAKAAPVQYVVPETPLVLPSAVVPAVASALPLAATPAAAAVGSGLFIPPLIIPGGGGGGGITTLVTPPGGGGGPTPVPGVPEPETWAMMIIGFGLLGGLLRRRRRTASENGVAHAGYAALLR